MSRKSILSWLTAVSVMLQFTGCGKEENTSSETASDVSEVTVVSETSEAETEAVETQKEAVKEKEESSEVNYTDKDLQYEWDSDCTVITAGDSGFNVKGNGASADKNTLTVSSAGTYYISGNIADGKIVVDTQDKKAVRLVMGGLDISCSDDVPINVIAADKLIITLENGKENNVTGTVSSSEGSPSGVLFSKSDLTVNGNGVLNVNASSGDGIVSKDKLKIVSGEINIVSDDDGIVGRDLLAVRDGQIKIASKGDGLHSKGEVAVSGGDINIVKSYEGIEGSVIKVSGGKIHLNSEDDGFNVASSDSNAELLIDISGGYIYVDAAGDGLDSNGNIVMSGGTVLVNGPVDNFNGPLDCGDNNNDIKVSGGVLIAAGSSGMFEAPSKDSAQNSVVSSMLNAEADTLCTLADESGNVIAAFRTLKKAQAIVISSPEINTGSSYKLYTGGIYSGTLSDDGYASGGMIKDGTEITSFDVSSALTVHGNIMSGGFGGRGKQFEDGMKGQRPDFNEDFDPSNMPEGFKVPDFSGDFDPSDMPEGFEKGMKGQRPDFNGEFDPSSIPEGFGRGDRQPPQMQKQN